MRTHYLQHVPFEGLGSIEPVLKVAGVELTSTRLFDNDPIPEIADIDLLIVLGGPMSVNDIGEFPWLLAEKKYIRSAIESGIPVLGICLGAQLIADALGARVYPNVDKEIGWYPIQGEDHPEKEVFRFPSRLEVFHWHGETFDLPSGAMRLASSEGCKNQAFQIGSSVIGLQFHLEITPDSARDLVTHCRDELVPAKYVQSASDLLEAPQTHYETINGYMQLVLSYLLGSIQR